MNQQKWQPTQYNQHASFVSQLGSPVMDLLKPCPGERILDLGCGDGTLAETMVRAGVEVVAVDSSTEMIAAARARGIDAHVMSGEALSFRNEFDAVFSNAALHWMQNHRAVIAGVNAALKDGGRFVAEFGAEGNVAELVLAMERVFTRNRDFGAFKLPWYFPGDRAYKQALEQDGFRVDYIEKFPRPTPLPTGAREWLKIFADHMMSSFNEEQRERFLDQVVEEVKPFLYTSEKGWIADYVRLRFHATKVSPARLRGTRPFSSERLFGRSA